MEYKQLLVFSLLLTAGSTLMASEAVVTEPAEELSPLTIEANVCDTIVPPTITEDASSSQADYVAQAAAQIRKENEEKEVQNAIWKRRSKYFYFVYGKQSVKNSWEKMNADFAVALVKGRTYYLHKKPLLGMIKFGLDWTQIDLNFAKYPDQPESASSSSSSSNSDVDLGIMQLEAAMGLGPSVTVNPVDHLKASLYFRVSPSYSLMVQNDELYHHYATFFNLGFTVSYKVISIGIEKRWCGNVDYNGLKVNDVDAVVNGDGSYEDIFNKVGSRLKTNTMRVFIGFRF